MRNAINARAATVGDALFNASRQVWLAGLGAAVVARDWAENEAGSVFRNLVREGTVVESRAFRVVGDRLDTSFTQANSLWKRARHTVSATVKDYADTATSLVRETLPVSLPGVPVKRVRPTAKQVTKRGRKAVTTRKAAKRVAKRASKSGKRA